MRFNEGSASVLLSPAVKAVILSSTVAAADVERVFEKIIPCKKDEDSWY